MIKLNRENDKYKNLFNQGIEFVYENDDIPVNNTTDIDAPDPVKDDVKKKKEA